MKNSFRKIIFIRLLFLVCFISNNIYIQAQNCNLVAGYNYTVGANGVTTLVSTSSGTNANSMYFWRAYEINQPINSSIFMGFTNPCIFTFSNNSTYQVRLSVYNSTLFSLGCSDSIVKTVTVNTSTCSATSPFILQKVTTQNFTWNGLVSYPSNVSNVNWSWGDGTTSTSLYPTHTYSVAGNYYICLSVTVSCGTIYSACTNTFLNKPTKDNSDQMITVNIIQDPTTSIASINNQNQKISIFPNPNNSSFSLQLNDFEKGKEVNLTITNLLGEEIYSEKFLIKEVVETKKLELSEAKSGTYFLKLHDGDKVKVTKLLIVK